VLPVVDLRQDDAVPRLRDACERLGFFTVVGHGIDEELIADVAARSRAFFDLPAGEKVRFAGPAETPGLPVYRRRSASSTTRTRTSRPRPAGCAPVPTATTGS
jgi:isopenicillin N synthase-like dioxygenase